MSANLTNVSGISGCKIKTTTFYTIPEESQAFDTYTAYYQSHVISVAVKTQISNYPCNLGYSYGYIKEMIWVRRGCRAEFTVQRCVPG